MQTMKPYTLNCRNNTLQIDKSPVIMGILNVTPDSFSDGGEHYSPEDAIARGLAMIGQGAGIIDIGGESTRPGSKPISPNEQIRRTVPVIEGIVSKTNDNIPISIDTTSSLVARKALEAGASIINDISALRDDENMIELAIEYSAPIIIMHMQNTPSDMQNAPSYNDATDEVKEFLSRQVDHAIKRGMQRNQIIVDPGIGFGKTTEHNLELMANLSAFNELNCPVLIGASRKSFIGNVLDIDDPQERVFGTAATVAISTMAGCHIIRVHDVKEMYQTANMTTAIMQYTK